MQAQLFHQHVTCKHISSIIVVNRMSRPQQNEGSHRPLRDNALLCNHLSTRALRPANRRDAGRLSLLPRTPPRTPEPRKAPKQARGAPPSPTDPPRTHCVPGHTEPRGAPDSPAELHGAHPPAERSLEATPPCGPSYQTTSY